jgi:LTXXQ motif family protein
MWIESKEEQDMRKGLVATIALPAITAGALFVTLCPLAYAQAPTTATPQLSGSADSNDLTDVRVNIVKAALQLTADQEKLWPAVEDAIRTRAKNRQERVANAAARINELRERTSIEILRDRDPIDFMHRRADALARRSADLKKLADAWQPLYSTLSPDQKRRMAFLTVFVLREVRSGIEQRQLMSEYEDYE